jgi:hypothetical protein
MLGLQDRLSCGEDTTQEYVNPSAHKESIYVAKTSKMPCSDSDVQRGVDLRNISIKNSRQFRRAGENILLWRNLA